MKLNIHKVGLTVGIYVAILHALWAIVVGSGMAGNKLDFALGMHFLSNPFKILTFSWGGGVVLTIMGAIGGYIMGALFAFVWNKVNRHK